ncbi:hypothetical protein K0M31_020262 [Melipona bicolor]|uniref:Uncharacterized protein n=1 Tax=Melipona bicolor TaxID=60889 RepID=A0AA40KQL9_9HYME|nr:hypothetical protein K0M31_020262 [Melipona bicolor]
MFPKRPKATNTLKIRDTDQITTSSPIHSAHTLSLTVLPAHPRDHPQNGSARNVQNTPTVPLLRSHLVESGGAHSHGS